MKKSTRSYIVKINESLAKLSESDLTDVELAACYFEVAFRCLGASKLLFKDPSEFNEVFRTHFTDLVLQEELNNNSIH